MTNFEFLTKYYHLQHTIMFDKLVDLVFALVGYSKEEKSVFWNNALVNSLIGDKELKRVENTLRDFQRKPVVYFEDRNSLKALAAFLKDESYKKAFEDSWQFWGNQKIDTKHFASVKKITNEKDLKQFLETFNDCYQKNDPQNPYGELGSYLKVAEMVWRRHDKTNRLEYFLVYDGNKPVAVSTLTNFKKIGYISNVGSLREARGKGFGKAATLYCVQESQKHGNKECCLATEEGEYPNEFYKRIGFSTRFTAIAFSRN